MSRTCPSTVRRNPRTSRRSTGSSKSRRCPAKYWSSWRTASSVRPLERARRGPTDVARAASTASWSSRSKATRTSPRVVAASSRGPNGLSTRWWAMSVSRSMSRFVDVVVVIGRSFLGSRPMNAPRPAGREVRPHAGGRRRRSAGSSTSLIEQRGAVDPLEDDAAPPVDLDHAVHGRARDARPVHRPRALGLALDRVRVLGPEQLEHPPRVPGEHLRRPALADPSAQPRRHGRVSRRGGRRRARAGAGRGGRAAGR